MTEQHPEPHEDHNSRKAKPIPGLPFIDDGHPRMDDYDEQFEIQVSMPDYRDPDKDVPFTLKIGYNHNQGFTALMAVREFCEHELTTLFPFLHAHHDGSFENAMRELRERNGAN